MTRRAFLTLPAVMLTPTAQPPVVLLATGKFNATDQEAQEGYFSIGTGAALILSQKGDFVIRAREQVGTTGALFWVRDKA